MQLTVHDELDRLNAELSAAKVRLGIAGKELRAAERKEERARDAVDSLREQISLVQLRIWGNDPDVAKLLAGDSGAVFYQAIGVLAESKGLGIGGQWADTKQVVLHIALNRGELGAVERVADGVRYFAPAVKRIPGGWARFSVRHRQMGECAWELLYSVKRNEARLVKQVYGSEEQRLDFATLEAALRHVEAHLWLEDIIDLAPEALLT